MKNGIISSCKLIDFKIKYYKSKIFTIIIFWLFNVKHKNFMSFGIPIIDIKPNGIFIIGDQFSMVNDAKTSTLGKNNKCKFLIYSNAILQIGNNVGMSNTIIVATKSIIIGNNVMIGGGVTIVDTDFHSYNSKHWHSEMDEVYMIKKEVLIKDNVFIGMDSIILKGVTIGSNVIIGAGSVVSKNIPDNEIWAGNPARFIKKNLN